MGQDAVNTDDTALATRPDGCTETVFVTVIVARKKRTGECTKRTRDRNHRAALAGRVALGELGRSGLLVLSVCWLLPLVHGASQGLTQRLVCRAAMLALSRGRKMGLVHLCAGA